MSMRSRHLGAVGTIIDGNVRDIAEQQSMEWPVSASVLIPFPSIMRTEGHPAPLLRSSAGM